MFLAALLIAGCMKDAGTTKATIRLQDIEGVPAADSAQAEAGAGAARGSAVSDGPDVPYVTTPAAVVDSMLALAAVTPRDVVYDLGSGDGRIPIRAAQKYGACGVGIEIRPDLVEMARQNAKEAGVADRVTFRQGDLFEADLTRATVVTLYLLPAVNVELRAKLLRELSPGARVVSRNFDMGTWTPDRTVEVDGNMLYLWHIPDQAPRFGAGKR